MSLTLSNKIKPVFDFVAQVIVGTILFLLVFAAAYGIAWTIHLVKDDGIAPKWLLQAAEYTEMLVFGIDLISYALFIIAEFARLVRALWVSFRETGL